MPKPRPVVAYTFGKEFDREKKSYNRIDPRFGIFQGYGIDYDEFESSGASYTCAIVEFPNGTIKLIPVDLIVFQDGSKEERAVY